MGIRKGAVSMLYLWDTVDCHQAELGRLPLRHHIIIAMLKYQFRYLIMNDNELISQAFLSQAKLIRNASNEMTYTQVRQSLKTSLGVNESSSDINNTVLIHSIKNIVIKLI